MKDARLLQILLGRLTRRWRKYSELSRSYLFRLQQFRESRNLLKNDFFLLGNRRNLFLERLGNFLHRTWVLAAIAVICLTGTIGYPLYNQPLLKVGMPAPQDYIAPRQAMVVDTEKTKQRRNEVDNKAVDIFMIDEEKNQEIERKLDSILEKGDEIRWIAGKFPFVELSELSESTQQYLRRISEREWELLQMNLNNTNPDAKNIAKSPSRNVVSLDNFHKLDPKYLEKKQSEGKYRSLSPSQFEIDNQSLPSPESVSVSTCTSTNCKLLTQTVQTEEYLPSPDFLQALEELKTHKIAPAANFKALLAKITTARTNYDQANRKREEFLQANPNIQKAFQNSLIVDLLDSEWENIKNLVKRGTKQIITQGIHHGLPERIIKETIELHLESIVSDGGRKLALSVMEDVIEPNLKVDEIQTEYLKKTALKQVEPIVKPVNQGEVIVRRSKLLTQLDIDILEHYKLNRREILWHQLLQLAATVALATVVFARVMYQTSYRWRQRDRLLILLLALAVSVFLVIASPFDFPYAPWSAFGLLVGSFYGALVGSCAIAFLVITLPMGLDLSISGLIAGGIAALVAANIAPRLRSREELALLGVAIAATEGGIYLVLKVLMGTVFGSLWYEVLQNALFFSISGFSWSIVALGISPYLEQLFDIVTPIRLAELANPNRPLLKRLAAETPGTFQHTLLVSSLAEAAARKLGCNVELVRAGTLYHDIGKMHDPLSFIENQMGRPNKHEVEIKDPWVSAAIIKKHVTEGLVMARRHRLPTAIQAFIPEHQGTMTIGYFYHQAQQISQENPHIHVDEADFRYQGPIPQSRETGIVMLADSCEAALRSLQDATPEQALVMLNNILRARWKDNQLANSGLTRADMNTIAEVFVEVWQQFHHKRIAYPKLKAGK